MTWQRRFVLAAMSCAVIAGDAIAEPLVDQDLLYARDVGSECEIGLWQTRQARATELVRIESCPERLFWEPVHDTVFLVDAGVIRVVELAQPGLATIVGNLPSLRFRDYLDDVNNQPNEEYLAMSESVPMKVVTIGRADSGLLSIHLEQWMAADDTHNVRLEQHDQDWIVTEDRWCDRWETECEFGSLKRDEFGYDWRLDPRDVWTDGVQSNRYFLRDEYLGGDDSPSPAGPTARVFAVDGKEVEMIVTAFESAHYSTMYTSGVVLVFPDGRTITICDEQCSVMLVDRYLLGRRFWGGTTELFDLGNGRSILGPLSSAQWIKARELSNGGR